jgi:DNA-directed RNA polymerase specialized sigma subunit
MNPLQRMIRAEDKLTKKLSRKPTNKELAEFIEKVKKGLECI